MSKRSTLHSTFVIERLFTARPGKVFAAWSDPLIKGRWFVGPDEWKRSPHQLDFRVGGRETMSGGPPGGPVHLFDARYQDIVPDVRLIYTYTMHLDTKRISASVATVEFRAEGTGTKMIFTEQGVFLDGFDDAAGREKGTRDLFDKLATVVDG
jgi:uncharacterized protein YndB with AHSA1/START domain